MAKMIVVEDRKGYNLSDKALEQRRSAANKKRVSCFMRRLEEKLKFHMDDYLRIQEISTMLTQSFTFDDIVELYRSEYDNVVTMKKMNVLRTYNLKFNNLRVLLRVCKNKSRVILENKIYFYVSQKRRQND